MILRTVRLRLAAAALALPLALACGSPAGPGRADREDLARAEARWAAQGVRSYTLVVGPRCFCGAQEIRTTVVEGVATERVFVNDGSPVPPNLYTEVSTVDAMLAHLDHAIRTGAHQVDATYDARGIPVQAYIDYLENAIDEEFGWQVVSFTPAP
jgi:hypothetical protein